jgi:hypothetical protein
MYEHGIRVPCALAQAVSYRFATFYVKVFGAAETKYRNIRGTLALTLFTLIDKVYFGHKVDICGIRIDNSSTLMHVQRNQAEALLYCFHPGL